MAYIQKRVTADGRTRYRVQIRKKGYPTQTATFERLTDARKWARDTEADIDHGRHFKTVAAKKHTFAELIDRYIEDVLPTNKRHTLMIDTVGSNHGNTIKAVLLSKLKIIVAMCGRNVNKTSSSISRYKVSR